MSDMNKQQAAVAAHQNIQQQQPAAQQTPMQQQVEGQTIQVQQVQLTHDGSEQMHPQAGQVASSSAGMNQQSTMVMAASQPALISQQAMQNMQAPMHSQAGATTITTMSTGPPQQMAEWPGHGRVQVIQQPIQNPTYIQPVYNAQGQLIVPGNIALHPGNMNQPIQVIAAGKTFQPGQMQHMITTPGKPIVQGQTTSFPGYATIPTSGNNQTLVISQLGVLGQTNILSQQQQGKPQEVQKMIAKTNVNTGNVKASPTPQQNVSIGSLVTSQPQGITSQAQTLIQPQIISPIQYTCNTQQQRTVPQGATQAMQFAPWQATFGPTGLPQGITWAPGAIQGSALLTQGSQIFIRNPQPEQPGMFIQNPQTSAMAQPNQMASQGVNKQNQTVEMGSNVQAKPAVSKAFSTILPNSVSPQQIRPAAAGVSTQNGQTQTTGQSSYTTVKAGAKVRTKNVCRMPTAGTPMKADAANQTKSSSLQVLQPKLVVHNIVPSTSGVAQQDNKLIKQIQNPAMQTSAPQQHPQAPLTQIQQMQNIFQEQMDQKQPGQIMVSSGIPNTGDRTLMPVVSMPPAQMAPIMGNMIVQTVPGIATMAPGISIPAGQPVQGLPVAQEIITATNPVPNVAPVKQTPMEQKEPRLQQSVGVECGPSRTDNESASTSVTSDTEDKSNDSESAGDDGKEENKESKDADKKNDKDASHQKATMMVKPQVLTHVIEGFVIQESSEPFPVTRGCVEGPLRRMPPAEPQGGSEPPPKRTAVEGQGSQGTSREMATCESCGKRDLKSKFKRSKRFCSMSCVKRFNVGWSSRVGLFSREEERLSAANPSNTSSTEPTGESTAAPEAPGPSSSAHQEPENRVNPSHWTVAEVCDFIRSLPGCAEYVDDFAMQDIDGEALMLLKADHLMSVMSIKLGPAVKIIAKIDAMRGGDSNPPS